MNETKPDTGLTVLVVDDHLDTLRLLEQELRAAGMRVVTATSGEAALSALDSARPDAVLLDILMQGSDGFATCERLRERASDLPVIFMTGLGGTDHVVRGFEVGGNDYVTKPVSTAEVVARLNAHTRTARLARATREAANAHAQALLAFAGGWLHWMNDAARALLPSPGDALESGIPLPAALGPLAALDGGAREVGVVLGNRRYLALRVSDGGSPVCVAALREDGATSPERVEGPPAALTPRESEVLVWVARGKTNRDIADILGMSPRTVNKHLEHVFEKLGVETRTAAAAVARRMKLE